MKAYSTGGRPSGTAWTLQDATRLVSHLVTSW